MSDALSPIADALVVVFTRGLSLAQWASLGLMDREWALYERLGPAYKKILLITHGDAADAPIAERLGDHVVLVCNEDGLETAQYEATVPERVSGALAGCTSAVVKTNQFQGGTLGVGVTRALRERGVATGFVARGGYLWSRFEATAHGPASAQAMEAGDQEREVCAAADVIVGTSLAMVGDLSWRYAIARDRVRLIPNYVLAETPDDPPKRDGQTVLYAGQLVARKRVDLVIDAVAMASTIAQREIRLSIIGEGPEQDALEAKAREAGVDATFEKRLAHRELVQRMSTCAVYVQASSLEGHPKTVIEAMSTGAPVIVTDAPGLGGMVTHGTTGLVFPDDATAIARGIAGVLEDPQWAQAMGEAAQSTTLMRYAITKIITQEHEAHRAAMEIAGDGAALGAAPVRWDAGLLNADVIEQVGAWERSLRGFARRLPDPGSFLMALDSQVYHLQGEMSVRIAGVHPKHELTRYHDFFTERVAPDQRVADLGCGGGVLSCAIAQTGAKVVGMEIDTKHAERARDRAAGEGLNGNLAIEIGDITAQRLEGEFDTIILSNILEHLRDRPELLRQWIDWYKPSRVLVRVPAFDRDWRVAWKKTLGVEWRLDPTHEIEYERSALERELSEGGLRIDEMISTWGEYWVSARPA